MNISFLEILLWDFALLCFVAALVAKLLSLRETSKPPAREENAVLTQDEARAIETRVLELDKKIAQEAGKKQELPADVSGLPGSREPDFEPRQENDRKVVEILWERRIITREIWNQAKEHQKKNGGTLVQFLLQYGFVNEKQLAQCVSAQFKIPYLPLGAYEISDEAIKTIPVDIAEKYWVMPVEKQGGTLMVVMINPLDTQAIKELEDITGLDIVPFVGIISEISSALRSYYQIYVKEQGAPVPKVPIYFIDTKTYTGAERRKTVRYNARIDVSFPIQGRYKKSKTVNVSREGLAFTCDEPVEAGTVLTLEIDLPRGYSALPISAVAEVLRCFKRGKKDFEIAVRTLKISKQEVGVIINYASRHVEV
jgi:hypothetical protein